MMILNYFRVLKVCSKKLHIFLEALEGQDYMTTTKSNEKSADVSLNMFTVIL